ncbi:MULTISPECIES: carbohydrate-binding module family 20 domain-containing protein [unclassified Streptomyces]|uniref:carbohydrate-binding module family 20 domain-containing protein n=1 Tax=unclassified Streptomyces TaxID=2593676 RepID=UPI00224EF2A8|nr:MULTISPECIES: carbohydrate-binding module family 20 domain-containing protein [unclassified Streptomyces]WSP54713.1 alpha-amylase family glycosyl hydrolase [Streptomyces sp. NBC_01241]WSU24608.1 alpha-amylase family glycosyl hydrolase [Streptomyces sp. NBC_01108]MCX4786271.1 alpha-amylase family glycosyl hydrolase [Streptomyces sp. NBC_01221]MCX4797871.1 alpha-amylase family glycosyl hydrolase [Streptomyces sp. NBC_01242]WSJ39143.1 alpha-amylase family glycosyl hydrolase [Streptomyces sp. N
MARRPLSAALALIAGAAALIAPTATAQASTPGGKDVTAVLFEWKFDSVAKACTDSLGPAGYGYVQVSPPQEHIQGSQWWTSYQPVSYKIAGRLGDRASFAAMVGTCHSAGVKVVADSVINHMSAGSGTGTGGSSYTKYNYPGVYSAADMDDCTAQISNYQDRANVQNCELVGLADLDTGEEYVRGRIAAYLDDLLSLGVDGFRIDAAKHMPAADLANIKSRLSNPNVYWKQEAIYGAGEAVQPDEYTGTGDVQEFRYARSLKQVFNNENLAYLKNFGEGWGFMPSSKAAVFVDNHDTERGGDTLNYKDGANYTLASVFMLAWPYGSPDVHSGYEWTDKDAGPPNGGTVNACYSGGWKCQHAWREISSMVGFRNTARGESVTDWWDNGGDRIAFGRGAKAYVAINHEGSSLTRTFQTSLPAGDYCDIQSGNGVSVDGSGRFTATLGANTALALQVGARTCSGGGTTDPGTSGATFGVNATTQLGQNIYVTGSHGALGNWNTGSALKLDPATYPVWKLDVNLPAGTSFEYKYLRKDASGNVTWESGANRTATVPASGKVTLTSDVWRS